MERRVLIGYDPEHGTGAVLELGRVLADVLAAKPLVVSAVPWPNRVEATESRQAEVDAALAEDFDRVRRELDGTGVSTRAVISSSAALTLSKIAASDPRIRLIVVGSTHHGRVGRTLLGSVGQSLISGAPCAVAVAPRGYGEREQHKVQRIAVAYDGSEEARTALETGVGLAARCHAAITLLAVADYPHYGYGTTWSVLTTGELADADHREKKRLLEEAGRLVPDSMQRDALLLTGHAGDKLAEASAEYDLIVIGSRGYGPAKSTLLGSTGRKLIADSACPVLVLPRAAGPDPLGVDPAADTTADAHPGG